MKYCRMIVLSSYTLLGLIFCSYAANIMEMGKVCKIQLVTQVSTSIPDYRSELPMSLPVIFFNSSV